MYSVAIPTEPPAHKLTQVLIVNYGIIIKSINTQICTVWHVDKYKITFKLVINHWTNEILQQVVVSSGQHPVQSFSTLLPMILVRSQIKNMLGGEIGKIIWEE